MFTHTMSQRSGARGGFTLLELLIVIAIIAILATILVIVINPVETLRRARDVERFSDLSTMKTSLGIYLTLDPVADIGTCQAEPGDVPTMVYYSLVDDGVSSYDNSVAGGSGNANYEEADDVAQIDGTGWIPVNFQDISGGSPISNLPVDPINTRATAGSAEFEDLVYRYACAETPYTFELNARLESEEFSGRHATDGGNNDQLYEVGTRLDILPDETDAF